MRISLFVIFFLLIFNVSLKSNEKSNIIEELKNLDNLKFNFIQTTNQVVEKGSCILVFPKKLKCDYSDKNKKEIIINQNIMAITQKRYNKTIYYPLSKSSFINILNKKDLIKEIRIGKITIDDYLNISHISEYGNKTLIRFNKSSHLLAGWVYLDQFNNKITFEIEIVSKNETIDDNIFSLPEKS